MRTRWWTSLILLVLAAVIGMTVIAPAPATAHSQPYCGIWWGSRSKAVGAARADWLMEGRVGRHRCYDRLVFELYGPAAGATVRYVDRIPLMATAGLRQPAGGARLVVRIPAGLPPASATEGRVRAELGPVNDQALFDVRGFRTFRDVTWGGISGRGTIVGLGVRARLPFRVFTLHGPGHRSRVVIDVAHRW